jgi:hypothetical protein
MLNTYLYAQAALLLRKQLAELNKNPVEGFSAGLIDDDDIFRWEVTTESSERKPRFSRDGNLERQF